MSRTDRLQLVITGPFRERLVELFDLMRKSDRMLHLPDDRSCAMFVLSEGLHKVREDLEREQG